jgi:hypothetical protein
VVHIKFLVVLLLLSASQMQHGNEGYLSRGILQPGGVFVGVDDVKLDASRSGLDEPLEVYIERVEDISGLRPPSSSLLTAETPYYRVGAAEYYRERHDMLIIRLPLPEGVSSGGLAVFIYVPSERIPPLPEEPDIADMWASASTSYFADTNEIAFSWYTLFPEGTVFTIVSGRYRP